MNQPLDIGRVPVRGQARLPPWVLREALSVGLLALLVVVLRGTVFGIVHVPGQAMRPTLLPGDSVYVDRLAYGLHVPFSQRTLVRWNLPARGDVVLFRAPVDDALDLKRIVGLPGDRIAIGGGSMAINGEPVAAALQTDAELYATAERQPSTRGLFLERLTRSGPAHFVERPVTEGSVRPSLGALPSRDPRSLSHLGGPGTREFVVPPGRYFCLGDNRDEAPEHRSWGFVDEGRVLGRAIGISYSLRPEPAPGQDRWRTSRFLRRVL